MLSKNLNFFSQYLKTVEDQISKLETDKTT